MQVLGNVKVRAEFEIHPVDRSRSFRLVALAPHAERVRLLFVEGHRLSLNLLWAYEAL